MKTINKSILFIIAGWIIFILFLLLISGYIYFSNFFRLEEKMVSTNTEIAYNFMMSDVEQINKLIYEYSSWDDTYNFVQDKNQNYISDSFAEDFFKSYKIDYVIFLDKKGDMVWGKEYDFHNKQMKNIPTDITEYFSKHSAKLINDRAELNNIEKSIEGIGSFFAFPNHKEVQFAAIYPVYDTDEERSSNGFLIFGKILSENYFKNFSEIIHYNTELIPISNLQKNNHTIPEQIAKTNSAYVKVENKDVISGFLLLKDVNFNPIGLLKINFPRTFYLESYNAFRNNALFILLFAVIGMIIMSMLVYGYTKNQELITRSFERFVPHQLIELLQKRSILEVILGTSTKKNLSVLFMDIRNFTTITEKKSPQESFEFINSILKEIAPLVIKNHGFIDKYIGDAIMALFPNEETNADDAVTAGMMILDELDKINYTGKVFLPEPIKIGIGINTGHSILGIIGAEGRLEGTVISDSVNTASRIQSLTKAYEVPMLISEETYKKMKHPEYYKITHVDDVQVKGKTITVSVYKIEKR